MMTVSNVSSVKRYTNSFWLNSYIECIASYGAPPATYSPTATSGHEGSTGGGATVTVMVAPKQGVLRYVPFAVNATVGTTIEFRWGGGPHTVTKGSALTPCNKSNDAPVFASGQQNKDFICMLYHFPFFSLLTALEYSLSSRQRYQPHLLLLWCRSTLQQRNVRHHVSRHIFEG